MWAVPEESDPRGTPGCSTWLRERTLGSSPARPSSRTGRPSCRSPTCPPSVVLLDLTVLEQRAKPVLIEEGHAELLGLRELRAGILAHDDVARLLRHAAGDLGAPGHDLRLGLLTREPLHATREHERHSSQRGVGHGDIA